MRYKYKVRELTPVEDDIVNVGETKEMEAIDKAREMNINPIMVVVLDHRGAIKACLGEEGTSPFRFKMN